VELPVLNLPRYEHRIKNKEGKSFIYDFSRKMMVVLTPEEWVRQHFVHFMIKELSYPKSLIKLESGIGYNQLQKRSDIKVYNRAGEPFAIVECKAANIAIGKATFDQVAVYNKTFRAPYIIVTNGLEHFSCEIDLQKGSTKFMEGFPVYESLA
jgi:hypothetical protein